MIFRSVVFCILVITGFAQPVLSSDFDLNHVSEQVQKTYNAMTSMQADFEQTSTVQGMSHRREYGRGTLIIQKPGQLRWDYVEPAYKVLVSDGVDISFYIRDDQQMFVSPASSYLQEDLTYRFFTGQAKIMEDFLVEKGDKTFHEDGTYCLKLTPKKTSGQVVYLYLWVDIEKFQLNHLQLVDQLNTQTDFRFKNMVMNKKYNGSIFEFSPPEGTEIILPDGRSVIQ